MTKKIVIAGSRNFNDYEKAEIFIKTCLEQIKPFRCLIIMSGNCSGADQIGEKFAEKHGCKIERYEAKWKQFGKAAGPIRNREMAEKCDAVICFWDGKSKGTASMIRYAKKIEKPLFIKLIPSPYTKKKET